MPRSAPISLRAALTPFPILLKYVEADEPLAERVRRAPAEVAEAETLSAVVVDANECERGHWTSADSWISVGMGVMAFWLVFIILGRGQSIVVVKHRRQSCCRVVEATRIDHCVMSEAFRHSVGVQVSGARYCDSADCDR